MDDLATQASSATRLSAERYQLLQELVEAACHWPADERDAFLARACPDNPGMLQEAVALLRAHEATADPDVPPYIGTLIGP